MDSDFWTMRLAAAKRQFNMQSNHHSQLDRFNVEDFVGEEEAQPDYPCPYCYEELDIASLCSHLEAEHSYESKSTVCPVCSVKVTSDMISHLTLQHGHLFKMHRRGRLRRVPFPNSQALSLLGRDLREAHLQVLLGGSGFRSSSAASSTAVTDNLLSSLVLNFPTIENDDISKSLMSSLEDNTAKNVAPQHMWKSSFHSSLSCEEREQRMRQAAGRAVFVQDLLTSTLLADQ
ncbi:protein DEHYDRATION-INDUCED 19 homolog 4-like [Salvia splendens]|uniref:protein DEHYDRATION-INDUCED 19 homolog 4-like n=1 Tax=Salvia splendens TaxID=180675 RepID=UPI001C276D43|nr:protein DEHYDRATION-INDUCED 19 homolog 4-like [Salvia splendens]XP_041995164.1 protein DEHYDRATION-INDUCED 19 homolog 4-like [Salvia splendens]